MIFWWFWIKLLFPVSFELTKSLILPFISGTIAFCKELNKLGNKFSCWANSTFILCLSFGFWKQAGQFSCITGKFAFRAKSLNNFSLQYISGLIILKSPASFV